MKTDVLLVPMGATYAEMRAAAIAAEKAGFDTLWTWDHLRPESVNRAAPPPECWTVLSALAEVTTRINLGPLVLNVANRHPGVLANMAATLQQVSNGRLMLGMGAGGGRASAYAAEQVALNRMVPPDRTRAEQVVEAVEVMRRLWAGDASTFEGTHYQLRRPVGFLPAEPPPPIIIAGFGPRMATIAGRYGDGFNTQAGHPRLEQLVRTAREAYTRRPGSRSFDVSVFARFEERWLRTGTADRHRLERMGVDRVILLVEPPFSELLSGIRLEP